MNQSWYLALGLAVATLCTPPVAGQGQSAQVMLEAARKAETIDGNPKAAIAQYEQIVKRFASDRAVVADALVRMAGAYKKLGDAQAKVIYERVVREYGDQASAASAARAALGSGGAAAAPAPASISQRRVWWGPDADVTGSVSRDGRYLSYTDWSTGDLALRDLGTGTSRRLTDKGPWAKSSSYAEHSVFSPDGRFIAFGWALPGGNGYELRVVDLQSPGAEPRSLTPRPLPWIAPHAWSSDGRWIAVLCECEGPLAVLDARSGGIERRIKVDILETNGIQFTPDSRAVVFERRVTGVSFASEVVAQSVEEGREQVLVKATAGRNVPLGWTPDGGLLFASSRSGGQALWLQRLQDLSPAGPPAFLKGDIGSARLGVTTSGALYYGMAALDLTMQAVTVDVASGRVEPGSTRPIESDIGVNMQPSWSPDGSALAIVNRRDKAGRPMALVIRTMANGEERELAPQLQAFQRPRWFPDGRSLVVQGRDLQARQGVFSIDAQTGATMPIVLAGEKGSLAEPQPSPDGTRVFFVRWMPSGSPDSAPPAVRVVERDLSTGIERELREWGGAFSVSPDGNWLATVRQEAKTFTVVVASVAGGAEREVHRETSPYFFGQLSWMPDSKHVVGLRGREGARTRETLLIPVDGGVPRILALPDSVVGLVAVHPDGRQFAYQMGERLDQVWVLENFLPLPPKAARR